MTAAALTFGQIKAQVATVRKHNAHERVIGIRARGRWTGERCKPDGNESYVIEQCDSPLAMRIALRENTPADTIKVLITSLDEKDLGEDILLRLAKRRLFGIDSWQLVSAQFQAQTIDPRVSRHAWIAEHLLEVNSGEDLPPAPGGFLDAETVWAVLLERQLDLGSDQLDLLALLKWSTEAGHVDRLHATPAPFRQAMRDWLVQQLGPVATVILDCMLSQQRPDALAVGLAAGVVFNQDIRGRLDKAAGKMEERYLGGQTPDTGQVERWSAAATEVVSLQLTDDPRKRSTLLKRADEILVELQAGEYAHVSHTLPLGFDQRFARFGLLLSEAIPHAASHALVSLTEAWQAIGQHEQSRVPDERRRLERSEMALRLVRWLGHSTGSPLSFSSLGEAAQYHATEGGFIDWARLQLRAPEPVRALSKAYGHLFDTVTAIREQHACHFAELLQDATASASSSNQLIPVENVLDTIVVPLAEHTPVLVIVIDGMSSAVCHALVADITRQDWVALCEDGHDTQRPGLAALPSVTQASRTSLLCGQLTCGDATDERQGFASHPGLLQHSRSSMPPQLFHKADVQTEAEEVRNAIVHPQRRVVGVVINAVDDLLAKGEQLDIRWSKDQISILPTLLHEAKAAGRVVVLLADHGHVLEHQTSGRSLEKNTDGGERWRADDGLVADGELAVRGPRVLLPDSHQLIAPWTECVRYGPKKSGYHGGISPQEMMVPISVLSARDAFPPGWTSVSIETPAWWQEALRQPTVQGTTASAPKPTKQQESPGLPLFDLIQTQKVVQEKQADSNSGESADEASAARSAKGATPAWINTLLHSPVFAQQKKLAGRTRAVDEHLAGVLTALDQAGGKLTSAALARAIATPAARLNGLIAILQRVLNIDGYQVLNRDETSDTIELNQDLLQRQFEIHKND